MKEKIAFAVSSFIIRRTAAVALVLALLTAFAGWRAAQLHINHNQIDLIPEKLPEVQMTKQLIDMIGSVGFLLVPLRGGDLDHIKKVADELGPLLEAKEEFRKVTFKQDVQFIQDRIGLFIKTEDLKEVYKRVRKKIKSVTAKNNPFHIELKEVKDEPLVLEDIVDKYRRMNKKAIDDPYYVDIAKEAILLVIKPNGESTDLEFIRGALAVMEQTIADYNANNAHGANLVEHYGDGRVEGATVTYGYTGTYKRNLDDSDNMMQAILPTSVFALIGILIYLMWLLRRPTQIVAMTIPLLMSVTWAFAFCELAIGELNSITAILAAILMGLGIDFGIHFMYRFREEYSAHGDLEEATRQTLLHSGSASLGCAATTGSALYILAISDFKGFADFGLIAGTGVIFAFIVMYTTIPTMYLLINRRWPKFAESLRVPDQQARDKALEAKPYPYAKRILTGTVAASVLLLIFAIQVKFDYDSRDLLGSDRPSIVLQDEITRRWKLSSDPVGVYTPSIEETRALHDKMYPPADDSTIDEYASIFRLVPPLDQQKANRKILDKLKRRMDAVTPDMFDDPRAAENWDAIQRVLTAQPYTVEELPEHIESAFQPVKKDKYPGYLTFIYPKVDLWDGEQLISFVDEVGAIEVGENTYRSGGITVLFARLAEIVRRDGIMFTFAAAFAILLITWLDFRSLRGAIMAMLPLLAGLVWMLGMMELSDWAINFMNIVVFPLVFGYGISAGVHLYHRFKESDSVMVAVKHTGAAITASSVTTLVGWGALLVSGHQGLASMGMLACFGIASTLVVSLTVMPAILQVNQNLRRKQTT